MRRWRPTSVGEIMLQLSVDDIELGSSGIVTKNSIARSVAVVRLEILVEVGSFLGSGKTRCLAQSLSRFLLGNLPLHGSKANQKPRSGWE